MGSGLWAKSTEAGDVCHLLYAVFMSRILGDGVHPVATALCKQAGDGKHKKVLAMDVGSRDSASTHRTDVQVDAEDWIKVP